MVHRTAQLVVADPLEQRLQRIQHVVVADLVVADRFPGEEHFGCVLGLDLHCMDEGFEPLDIPGFPDFRQNTFDIFLTGEIVGVFAHAIERLADQF